MKFDTVIDEIGYDMLILVKMVDASLSTFLSGAIPSNFDKYVKVNKGEVTLAKPFHILLLAGKLLKNHAPLPSYNSADKLLPCTLFLKEGSKGVRVNANGLVEFPAIDGFLKPGTHSYFETAKAIEHFQFHTKTPAHMLAQHLLRRMAGHSYPAGWDEMYCYYFDCLLVLMFGVEVSKNNFTAISNLMLLDLIASQSKYSNGKLFDWSNAFISRRQLRMCDRDGSFYAGKFPMAVKNSGKGSTGKGIKPQDLAQAGITIPIEKFNHMRHGRGSVLELVPDNLEEARNIVSTYPHRHGILKRELALMYHWLNHAVQVGYCDFQRFSELSETAQSDDDYINFVVGELVMFRFTLFMGDAPELPPNETFLSNNEERIGAMLEGKSTEKSRNLKPQQSLLLNQFVRTVPLELNGTEVSDKKQHNINRFFHRSRSCKLVPGYVREGEYTLYGETGKSLPFHTSFRIGKDNANFVNSNGFDACPSCFK